MSAAYKCERCGTYVDGECDRAFLSVYRDGRPVDICPKCREDFDKFMQRHNIIPIVGAVEIDDEFKAKVEKVVKAIQVCLSQDCEGCPYDPFKGCSDIRNRDTIEVIEKFKEMLGYED